MASPQDLPSLVTTGEVIKTKDKRQKTKEAKKERQFSLGGGIMCLLSHPEVQSVLKDLAHEPNEKGVCAPLTHLAACE